jgi:hypothetical protein
MTPQRRYHFSALLQMQAARELVIIIVNVASVIEHYEETPTMRKEKCGISATSRSTNIGTKYSTLCLS